MPTDLAEDAIDLTIPLLEAITPQIDDSAYPFPRLSAAGRSELREFRSLVLENPYLAVTLVPDLGGRIIRLFDKRTQTDIFPFDGTISASEGGPRGMESWTGLQISTGFETRLNSLGTVATMPDYAEEEEAPSGVWWGELCGNGMSLNVRISLPANRAEVEIEVRAFNRSLEPVAYNGGLLVGVQGGFVAEDLWIFQGQGLRIHAPALRYRSYSDSKLVAHRFNRQRSLEPHQLDSWTAKLTPFSGMEGIRHVSEDVAVFFDQSRLQVQAITPVPDAKLVLQTEAGQTLELTNDLYPENLLEIPLSDLSSPAQALAVLDSNRLEIFRSGSQEPKLSSATREQDEWIHWDGPTSSWTVDQLEEATFSMRDRALAHLLLAQRHLRAKEYSAASQAFEQSLLFNAEDHLAWWGKAVSQRLQGEELDERPELLNAHFLAPLEPALRAESYLVNPSQTKESSPILKPLMGTPEAFIEVACLLLEANLLEETAKWLDEALRHVDFPMLRYLLAFAYLSGSRMEVEAADQVAIASKKPVAPPYPYRALEGRALEALSKRFPGDASIRTYLDWLAS